MSIPSCSSAFGICDQFLDISTAETGSVTRELCQLVPGEVVWNPPQFRLEDRVTALLFRKSDLDVRREAARAENRWLLYTADPAEEGDSVESLE